MIAGLVAAFLIAAQPSIPDPGQIPDSLYQAYPEAPTRELEVTWQGSRYILVREYDRALEILEKLKDENPESAIPSLGKMFLYHIRMLENFDFRFEKEFYEAQQENIRVIKEFYHDRSSNRWHNLVVGGSFGLRGMMFARHQRWLKAASLGWDGMKYIKKAAEQRPGFPPVYDAYYGLGMFHYWISWAQQKSLILSFFPDRRDQGLRELEICAQKAPISGPMAVFALAYFHGVQGRLFDAFRYLHPLYRKYPQSILARSLFGRLLVANRQLDAGIAQFESILEEEPNYTFVGFHLARTLYYRNQNPERVLLLLEAFLAEKHLKRPKIYRSKSFFYVAEIYASRRKWKKAKSNFQQVDKDDLSLYERQRYDRLKKGL